MTPPWPAIPLPLLPLFAALTINAPFVMIIGALAGPIVAYIVAARRFSGKIETTEARELWKESRAIREWSQRRMRELEQRNRALEDRVEHLENENAELRGRLSL